MNCPVCNAPEIEDDAATCPQCQSDLEIFRLLTTAGKQRQTLRRTIGVLAALFAVAAIGWALSGSSSDETAVKNETSSELSPVTVSEGEVSGASESEALASLKSENEKLKSEIGFLNEKVNSLTEKLNAKPIVAAGSGTVHIVQAGESLWKIAVKYFGNGKKYVKIAKDNGLSAESILLEGMKLKINP